MSCLCEQGVETHLAKKSFLRLGDGHEPLIRKGGVYFVKAQTVNAVENTTRDKSQERCVQADGSEKSCVQADGLKKVMCTSGRIAKSRVYKLMDCKNLSVQADGLKNSCVQADGLKNSGLQNSCVRADERSEKSCVRVDGLTEKSLRARADGLKNSCVRAVGSESQACELRRCKSRADERVLVSECGKLVELKSLPTVKEIACVKMQT